MLTGLKTKNENTSNIIFLYLIKEMSGQFSLEQKVDSSKLVFEGKVIADSGFMAPNTSIIYTAEFVLVSKQFKGFFVSDTVMVLTLGGRANGILSESEDAHRYLYKGDEGIFFCNWVNPKGFMGIKKNSAYWACVEDLGDGFIRFNCDGMSTHKASCSDGTYFDDINKDLYQTIEKVTGQPYKQLNLSCWEESRKKK